MTGPSTPANIASLVDATVAGDPDRIALVAGERCVSYAELADQAAGAGAAVTGLGAAAGQRIALVATTSIESVAAVLGIAGVGAVPALLNPALTAEEMARLCEIAGAPPPLDVETLTAAGGDRHRAAPERAGGDGDEALVLFTSGTTGLPKPVPVTHAAVFARVRAYAPGPDLSAPPGVRLMAAPMFHIGGLLGLLISLWAGHTTVLERRFDAGEWLELVERHRVDSAFVVPTMLHRIVEHPDLPRRDLSSLKALAYGAAAAPVDLVRRAMEAMPGVGFANTFGQTETLGGYTALTPQDHHDPVRIGSVGKALPGVELRVVRPGTDEDVPDGETGELLVRSEQNVRPGWLRTGDLGRIDAEGYVYPMGRLADTINRGGEKFGPVEIEAVLRRHADVAEAGVAGLADLEMGERVVALVVLRDGAPARGDWEDELRRHCRGHLAPFKVPEHVVVVDRLPYDQLGKLRRSAIAAVVAGSP